MSARRTPPVQEEVERELRDKFQTGDITSVAAWLGCDRTSLSRQLNPEEPQSSVIFETLRFLDACERVRPELFEDVSGILLNFIGARRSAGSPSQNFAVSDLTEAIKAYFNNAPYSEQLKATRRAIATLEAKERELMEFDLEDSPDERRAGDSRLRQAG